MAEVASAVLSIVNGQVSVRGTGFTPGGKVRLSIRSTATNGDSRNARHRATVAGAGHPTYAPGEVDFTEPLIFATGTVEVQIQDEANGNVVAEETFNLG
jgi:uncharacterized protein YfaP (DUF2135 family)